MKRGQKAIGLFMLVLLLCASGFALLSVANEAFDVKALECGGWLCLMLAAHYALAAKLFRHSDRHMLIIVYVLTSVGMIMQYRIKPDIAFTQLVWIALAMGVNIAVMLLMRFWNVWRGMTGLIMLASVGLLGLALAFGRRTGGAYNWINIGGFSFQPSEYVKVLLVFAAASELSKKPSAFRLGGLFVFIGVCVCLLVASRDLGAAAILALTALAMYFIATGDMLLTVIASCVGAGGAVLSYELFDHVKARVAAWRNPWSSYLTNGYQIAQGLMAIASGGMLGLGIGRGAPKLIPAYHTDYIFAVICEEMGIISGVLLLALYVIFFIRGYHTARNCQDSYLALMAAGLTTAMAVQTFLILGGVIKLIPLTGVTLPFVSYGGSSMMSSYIILGILEAIAQNSGRDAMEERF